MDDKKKFLSSIGPFGIIISVFVIIGSFFKICFDLFVILLKLIGILENTIDEKDKK